MITQVLEKCHKVLGDCSESIARQQKENSQIIGFIKATQLTCNETKKEIEKLQKLQQNCSNSTNTTGESSPGLSPDDTGRFVNSNGDLLRVPASDDSVAASQFDLYEFLLNQKLGFVPDEGENVFSFAKKVVASLLSQLRNAKGNINRAQTLLEQHEVLLFQSEELSEGIHLLIEKLTEKRREEKLNAENQRRVFTMPEQGFLVAARGIGLNDDQAKQALDILQAMKKRQEVPQTHQYQSCATQNGNVAR